MLAVAIGRQQPRLPACSRQDILFLRQRFSGGDVSASCINLPHFRQIQVGALYLLSDTTFLPLMERNLVMSHRTNMFVVGTLSLALAACGSSKDPSKSNFSKAIQSFLDTQKGLCAAVPARQMPFILANEDLLRQQERKRADALTDAGLLNRSDTETKPVFGNGMQPAGKYDLTEKGKKFLVANAADTVASQDAFCTGKYTMVDVDNFTEPSNMMGVKLSEVNFRYKVQGAEDWANSEAMRASYRNFAEQTGDIKGRATLVLTNDGWMHERLFKR